MGGCSKMKPTVLVSARARCRCRQDRGVQSVVSSAAAAGGVGVGVGVGVGAGQLEGPFKTVAQRAAQPRHSQRAWREADYKKTRERSAVVADTAAIELSG